MLNFALESGMIDLDTIQMQIEMNERKKYLEMHNYKVWQGKNDLWYTKIDEIGGTKLKKRKTIQIEWKQRNIVDFAKLIHYTRKQNKDRWRVV